MKSINEDKEHRFSLDISQEAILFKNSAGLTFARIEVETAYKDGPGGTQLATDDFYLHFSITKDVKKSPGDSWTAAWVSGVKNETLPTPV